MHLYLMTRGIKHQRDLWVSFMQSQFYEYVITNPKNPAEKHTTYLQGALRPIELWEYVIPETALNEVLSCMDLNHEHGHPKGRNVKEWAMLATLRKALNCEMIPDIELKPKTRAMKVEGVAVQPIGIKKDDVREAWGAVREMV